MEIQSVLLRELEGMPDAALGELDQGRPVRWRKVGPKTAYQVRDDGVGERPERQPAAARADCRQETAGIVTHEDQDRAIGGLLQDFEDRIRGVPVHLVS